MQPFIVVLIFFAACLAYGIYRAIQDVREDAFEQEALGAYYEATRDTIAKMTGLSESFMGIARSTETANESIKRFSVIIDPPGDGKELCGYLSKDCVS